MALVVGFMQFPHRPYKIRVVITLSLLPKLPINFQYAFLAIDCVVFPMHQKPDTDERDGQPICPRRTDRSNREVHYA